MELSEQLGVVPRGLSDAAFGALRTTFFKDLEPGLGPLSPTLSTVSQSDNGTGDLSASVSPTLASFSSPRIRRARTGKWIAQCSICLEEYGSEDICVTLDCTHFFHQSCVRVSMVSIESRSYNDDPDSNGSILPLHVPYVGTLFQEINIGAHLCHVSICSRSLLLLRGNIFLGPFSCIIFP
jgi:hypothetical protein